ncbi:hypothetical protein GQ54DRAFT_295174 [Martensiomyces pterosporus]|nr:hypothetical protein GQ54DRAFT_295174 [Martensiomyces pterosporus]
MGAFIRTPSFSCLPLLPPHSASAGYIKPALVCHQASTLSFFSPSLLSFSNSLLLPLLLLSPSPFAHPLFLLLTFLRFPAHHSARHALLNSHF